jgi:hypothetical protein
MDEHVGNLSRMYRELRDRKSPAPKLAPVAAAGI